MQNSPVCAILHKLDYTSLDGELFTTVLLCGVAAIHDQGCPRDPSGLVGGEVQRGGGNVLGRPHPTDGVHSSDFVAALLQVLSVEVYLYPGGADRIHADLVLGKVQRHTLRQQFDTALGGVIGALFPLADVTREIEEQLTMAPPPFSIMWGRAYLEHRK